MRGHAEWSLVSERMALWRMEVAALLRGCVRPSMPDMLD